MTQSRVRHDALLLVVDNLDGIVLDLLVVALDNRLHLTAVGSGVPKVGKHRDWLVTCRLRADLLAVDYNLGMKDLLVYALVNVVADSPDKHTLRESGDLARWDKTVHLSVEGMADVLTVD